MKKILLTVAIVAVLVCTLAIFAGAQDIIVKHANDSLSNQVSRLDALENEKCADTESLIVLTDLNGGYYVFPAYYVIKERSNYELDMTALNSAIGAYNEANGTSFFTGFDHTGGTGSSRGKCHNLVRIELPTYVTTFNGNHKFEACSNLKQVIFPYYYSEELGRNVGYVTNNGTGAQNWFSSCSSLESVDNFGYLPLTTLQNACFSGCSSLKTIELPYQLTSIVGDGFNGCSSLTKVVFPSTLETVGTKAFYKCSSLRTIENFENTQITIISQNMFNGCALLEDFIFPSELEAINSGAFNDCAALTTLTFPSTLETLGKASFKGCTALKYVYNLENTDVTWMGETFMNCSLLEYVRLPHGLVTFESGGDGTFRNCSALTSVGAFPSTLEFIGKNSFAGCGLSGVLDLSVCTSLTTFQGGTFSYTKITKVILSTSIVDLGDHTFANCSELTEIVGLENLTVAQLKGNLIENCEKMTALYLPINPSDGLLEVSSLLWDVNAHVTVYVANDKVRFQSDFYQSSKGYVTIVYCGSDYETFLANNTVIANKVGTNLQNADTEITGTKHAFVYGYNLCRAFYGNQHVYSENKQANVASYFEAITVGCSCTRVGCGIGIVEETIDPIFTWKGYSACTFGTGFSITQGYTVNQAAIDAYLVYAPDFFFGVLAAVNESGEEIAPRVGDAGVLTGEFVKNANDYLDIKVTGIPETHINTKVVFCVYVTVGEEVYYLDNNITAKTVCGVSYGDVIGEQ